MFEFKLPDLGEGVAEGEILKWYVDVGGDIGEDDPLVDIETDKAAVTIPSPRAGKIASVAGGVGDTVEVGDVLVTIDESSAGASTAPSESAPSEDSPEPASSPSAAAPDGASKTQAPSLPPAHAPAPKSATPAPSASRPSSPLASPAAANAAPPRRNGGPVPAAPATRRLARELGIDLSMVQGTGPGGRVTAEDVRLYAEGGIATMAPSTPPPPMGESAVPADGQSAIPYYELEEMPTFEQYGPVERVALRSIRRKVAKKMVTSMVTVPHVAHMDDADVTELEAYRTRLKAQGGASVTLMAFVMKSVASSMKRYPMMNASIDPYRGELVYKGYVNVGFAADTPRGLLVPVVKNADRLSVVELSAEIRRLAEAAREGTIDVSDLQGGTFTITNVGSLGGKYVIPTINYPESAILGMGRTADEVVVRDGDIVVRKITPLCITYDHRIADGADGARFMNELVRHLSDPISMLAAI